MVPTGIQMVDLQAQHRKIREDLDAAVAEVIDSAAFINGPAVKTFSNELAEYLNVKHVIPCANGTDALQIAMMAYDFPQGAEILVPSWTYVATVEVIALLGLKPVFVDAYPDTFNLDIRDLEDKISHKSVAIVPVHLYGQCSDMERITAISKEHNLIVVEDTAQALGADYRFKDGTQQKAGTIGNIGTTSFFPSKNLGCMGDGGAMFTNNDEVAQKLRMIANHGQKEKYVNQVTGINSRLDTIQAAILSVKLRYLDEYAKARNQVALKYDEAFKEEKNIQVPTRSAFSSHVFHQYTLRLTDQVDRNHVKEELMKKGIPSMVYYPIPNHLQPAYVGYGYKKTDLPTTEWLSERVISLPIHTEMQSEVQDYIIENVKSCVHEY